ncbi:protein NEOXANTHIN-DEFICIENT 1 isoform X4 [Macadamia integrifolia]|uniref:protein NEOXANTHIN-DEFICIENT 1 isoform X4 n=1 Tax=Macadamia integrifolia TaxID=60698 RepID=UPI001C4E73B2|nr:protein NEOXANTHIN-DEFICIENT 1 isoform X4 [Macadamia integrifolia]
MGVVEATKSSSGYAKPPWMFTGSALYQLHLVKAETARALIPKEFRLVEAFGYTLGGFFLAHYDDSPAGIFDELVVIAGIVWNPPTSCAWAARVLVNSHEACFHGRKSHFYVYLQYIGLPSQVAGFSKRTIAISERSRNKENSFLHKIGFGTAFHNPKDRIDVQVAEIKDSSTTTDFCCISLPTAVLNSRSDSTWMGPIVKMSLPSYSGHTEVRAVTPAKVSGPTTTPLDKHGEELLAHQSFYSVGSEFGELTENDARNRSISVLLSKPVLALEFNFLKMQVEPPIVVAHCSKNIVED